MQYLMFRNQTRSEDFTAVGPKSKKIEMQYPRFVISFISDEERPLDGSG